MLLMHAEGSGGGFSGGGVLRQKASLRIYS
jgi:hypothetical protein